MLPGICHLWRAHLLISPIGCGLMLPGLGKTSMRNLGIAALGVALAGCASSSADITPTYVSPVQYQSYNCQQLGLEAQSISPRAAALSGAQDSQRTKDGVATAAEIVIFWPAAFFVGGDKQTAAELSQMKGQWLPSSKRQLPRSATFSSRASRLAERPEHAVDRAEGEENLVHERA